MKSIVHYTLVFTEDALTKNLLLQITALCINVVLQDVGTRITWVNIVMNINAKDAIVKLVMVADIVMLINVEVAVIWQMPLAFVLCMTQ